jgi:hypothetical protein
LLNGGVRIPVLHGGCVQGSQKIVSCLFIHARQQFGNPPDSRIIAQATIIAYKRFFWAWEG